MIGRGIDQIMRAPASPELYESYLKNANDYVSLAERTSGPIPRSVDAKYIWGDLLGELTDPGIAARIINLETAVTRGGAPWPGKGIHYRVSPKHLDCLAVARIDCCQLANNHTLDWGYSGLSDTIASLKNHGIGYTGAGESAQEAAAPTIITPPGIEGRVLVWAYGMASSGVPLNWAATRDKPGVNVLPDLSEDSVNRIARDINRVKRPGDVVITGIHWGPNWGYSLPPGHREFAHRLVDEAGVDVVHGHSSHHVAPIEIHHRKLILYGCGDLLNDYEGIGNFGSFRGDLGLLYLPTLNPRSGELEKLNMVPTRIHRFQLTHTTEKETSWLRDCLNDISSGLGVQITVEDGRLRLA